MALHEKFMPRNKYGDPLPRAQRWGDMVYDEDLILKEQEEMRRIAEARAEAARKQAAYEALLRNSNFGEKNADIKEQLRRLKSLNDTAKEGLKIKDIINPRVGDFKSSEDGTRLFRFTDKYWKRVPEAEAPSGDLPEKVPNPKVGDFKKIKGNFFKYVNEPTWLQVKRDTNYDLDLADTFDRYTVLGRPYLNARDRLWAIFYPEQAPIYRPRNFRRRNTRRNRRRSNRRNGTRKY